MQELLRWLDRLDDDPSGLYLRFVRGLSPGMAPLLFNDFLFATTDVGTTYGAPGDRPQQVFVLQYVDTSDVEDLSSARGMIADIGAVLTYASRRRVRMTQEIAFGHGSNTDRKLFVSSDDVFDRRALAPVTGNTQESVQLILERLRAVPEKDRKAIGTAIRLHYASTLLLDRDIAAAYALLVASVEILSRTFGTPSVDWADWHEASRWEDVFQSAALSPAQAALVRAELMRNRELRLAETFASYASQRPRDEFFAEVIEDWIAPILLATEAAEWGEGAWFSAREVRQEVPDSRDDLRRVLRTTYEVRSKYLHRGEELPVNVLAKPTSRRPLVSDPLTYAGLRLLLLELIDVELTERGQQTAALPDFQIHIE